MKNYIVLLFLSIHLLCLAQEPIHPEPPIRVPEREIPCKGYTVPGTTIQLWDWTIPKYTLHYYPGNNPAITRIVDSPFHSSGFQFSPNTAYLAFSGTPDYKSSDGWELLFYTLGSAQSPADEPAFGLYNRYSAQIRVFVWLEPNGETNYQSANIEVKHQLIGSSQSVSALFEHLNMPANALSEFDKFGQVSQVNKVIINGTWLLLEFAAAYDPCVCQHASALTVETTLNKTDSLFFSVEGSATSSPIYESSSGSTGPLGAALRSFNGLNSSLVDGYKTYKELSALGSVLSGFVKAAGISSSFLPSWYPAVAGAAKILGFLVGGGQAATRTVIGYNHDFTFTADGNLSSSSFYQPYLFYTPGSFYDPLNPLANRPFYDNPLGVFNLLEPPVIEEYTNEIYQETTEVGAYDITEYYLSREARYQFKSPLKYVVNTSAGITGKPLRLMGSLIFTECEEGPSALPLDLRFEATPFVNIECLEEYTTAGAQQEWGSVDGGGNWNYNVISDGCTQRPELQILAVLERDGGGGDDIVFSARYKPRFVPVATVPPANPFEGLTSEQIALQCDPPVPSPVEGKELGDFCADTYDPRVRGDLSPGSPKGIRPSFVGIPQSRDQASEPSNGEVSAYPVPFGSLLAFDIDGGMAGQMLTLTLQDALGRTIQSHSFFCDGPMRFELTAGLDKLPSGMYYARVTGDRHSQILQLPKQK